MAYLKYCELHELKKYLGIEASDTSKDEEIEELINALTGLIDIELGWNLGLETITRRMGGMGSDRVIMEYPVKTLIYGKIIQNRTTSRELELDFIEGRMVYFNDIIPKGNKNFEVQYERGFETVPADLKAFFLRYCKEMYNLQKDIDSGAVKTKKIEGLSVTYFSPSEIIQKRLTGSGSLTNFSNILKKYKVFNAITYG